MQIRFKATKEDAALIDKLVLRAHSEIFTHENGWEDADQSRIDTEMDLTACHLNGCRLDLQKLLTAEDFTFAHDITGIRRNISRSTGAMENCFLPRCAMREAVAA